MMTVHGLCMRFRSGKVLPSGPGDTLRFVHALRQYLEVHAPKQQSIIIVTHSRDVRTKVARLFSGEWRDVQGDRWLSRPDGKVVWIADELLSSTDISSDDTRLMVHEAIQHFAGPLALRPSDHVVHAFVTHEPGSPNPDQVVVRPWERIIRINRSRIDTPEIMCATRWALPAISEIDQAGRVAVVVRSLDDNRDGRDTPSVLLKMIVEVASELGVELIFFGASEALKEVPGTDSPIGHDGLSYVEQMLRYAKLCTAAIGTMSGGLDLATAGGLPTLRLTDFTNRGYRIGDWENSGRWGRTYNWFLANRLNIGIEPPAVHNAWWEDIEIKRLRSYVRGFLGLVQDRSDLLNKAKYVLVRRDDIYTSGSFAEHLSALEEVSPE